MREYQATIPTTHESILWNYVFPLVDITARLFVRNNSRKGTSGREWNPESFKSSFPFENEAQRQQVLTPTLTLTYV